MSCGVTASAPVRKGVGTPQSQYAQAAVEASVRKAIAANVENQDRKVSDVQIRRVEGQKIYGTVKINDRGVYNRLLLDFQARVDPLGEVSSLEVNGKEVIPRKVKSPGSPEGAESEVP